MRYGISILILCLMLPVGVWGQTYLSLGARASYDLNTYKADSEDQFGFNAGIHFQVKPNRIFYWDTGLILVQKRFRDPDVVCDDPTLQPCPEDRSGAFYMLKLPLLMRVNLSGMGNYRPFVAAGIAGGRILGQRNYLNFEDGTRRMDAQTLNPWAFFFYLRVGMDFELDEKKNLLLEAHGSYTTPVVEEVPGSNFVSVGVAVSLLFDLNGDPPFDPDLY